jgi:hypothetical protein
MMKMLVATQADQIAKFLPSSALLDFVAEKLNKTVPGLQFFQACLWTAFAIVPFASSKSIEVFVINHANDKMSMAKMPGLGDLVESLLQFGSLARIGFTSTHEQGEDSTLKRRNEENEPSQEVSQEDLPEGDAGHPGQRKPENGDGQGPYRGNGDNGHEGVERCSIEVAAPFSALTSSFVLFPL